MATKKIVLVTGCTTGGIGYETAKAFEKSGCRVYAAVRRLDSITGIDGLDIHKIYMDVLDEVSIKKAVEDIVAKEGRIDIVFNNAGVGLARPLIDMDAETTRKLLDTNITSVILVSKYVAPQMIRQGAGLIVNVGSVTAYATTPFGGLYAASKAAVHSLSNCMRLELAPFGVKVSIVAPGAIKSNIGDNNLKAFYLPENSYYQTLLEYVMARANASQAPGCTPTAVFAQYVVKQCVKSSPPRYIDYGYMTNLFRIVRYLPWALYDFFFSRRFGLLQLGNDVRAGKIKIQ
ncbi:hypothetical protein DFQ26_003137 [Actinomortierella ambigua]|nr:hypothetical protein DFQ26_003137 [Actinomortierella ambigua]